MLNTELTAGAHLTAGEQRVQHLTAGEQRVQRLTAGAHKTAAAQRAEH